MYLKGSSSRYTNDASNNICSVYTWTEFEGNKGMNNVASCLLSWLNDKGHYSQSYVKNNKMPEIAILFDNYGGQNTPMHKGRDILETFSNT